MRLPAWLALAAGLGLAACATTPDPTPPASGAAPSPVVLSFASLRGWSQEDHRAAFEAFRSTCRASADPALAGVCARARSLAAVTDRGARQFLEAHFRPEAVTGQGILTAYFAPEYEARERPDADFSAPVRPRPADLPADTNVTPYLDRAAIEARDPSDAIAWMRPEDLFFLQIQGSGALTFPGGRRMKAVYVANNGRPFLGIARPMRERGLLADNNTSADSIHNWLVAHRGPEAQAIMRLNPRYAFFRLEPDDGNDPAGAAGIPLPAGRAIAVDLSRHALGGLYWIDAEAPALTGAFPAYRRVAVALDTGGAIQGDVRADLYLGRGAAAGLEAGRVRHTLRLYRLAPLQP